MTAFRPYRPESAVEPAGRSAKAHLRAFTVFYALLIVHLSLYPYANWRDLGAGAWEYWLTPWIPPQQRFLPVDAAMNVLAYIPLGSLLLFCLPQHWRRFISASLATVAACSLLSAGLESVQTFLPARVPSKMDWLCNSVGAGIGVLLARTVLTVLQRLRRAVTPTVPGLLDDANWEATLTMGLWLFCLLSPLPLPYVMGPWLGDIWLFFVEGDMGDDLLPSMEWLADWESTAQVLASVAGLTGALCLGLAQTKPGAQRLPLFALLLLMATLSGWGGPQILPLMQGGDVHSPAFVWGNTGLLCVLAAMLMSLCLALSDWPSRRLALLSVFALLTALVCTAFLPGYSQMALRPQSVAAQRTVEHLMAAADWIGAIWPALGMLVAWRLSRNAP
jgi:VanZ family protein